MSDLKKPGQIGFRVIGILKLVSGVMALAFGIGVFRFLGHDPGPAAERIITHLGLDPQNHVIHALLSGITGIDKNQLRALEVGTFFYAVLHMIEGTGLILGKDWAGYLVIVATSSLVPFEIYEIARKVSLFKIAIFIVNIGIVIYLIAMLRKEHQARANQPA